MLAMAEKGARRIHTNCPVDGRGIETGYFTRESREYLKGGRRTVIQKRFRWQRKRGAWEITLRCTKE